MAVERHGADEGVVFHSAVGDEVFVIDPVPRVIAAAEWARIEAGLAQRVRALNAFVADVYGERRIVAEGVVPAARDRRARSTTSPRMQGVEPPGGLWIGIAGLDLVRDADGRFQVLEDNVRTPSGFAYAAAARRALVAQLDLPPADAPRHARRAPASCCGSRSRPPRPTPGRSRDRLLTDGERQRRLLRARVGGQGDRRPAGRAGRARRARRRRHRLPPHQRRPARHQRSAGCCSSRSAAAASRSSTRSAPGSPTTSSPTPTSRT